MGVPGEFKGCPGDLEHPFLKGEAGNERGISDWALILDNE